MNVLLKVFLNCEKEWDYISIGQEEKDELYNLKKDPNKQNNLINVYPEQAKEIRRIAKTHIKHQLEVNKIRTTITKLKLIKSLNKIKIYENRMFYHTFSLRESAH